MDTGPKKDIAGELMKAYRAHGLKTLGAFHHAYNICGKFYGGNNPDQTANVDFDSDLTDPDKALLYGNLKSQKDAEQFWLDVLKDYIVKNKPDQLYFDWGLRWVSQEKRVEMASFYYDFCEKNGIEGIIAQKSNQIPEAVSIRDFERSGARNIMSRVWQTDDSPGPWMYKENATFKGSDWILSVLLDVVSKNGVLLLNIAPEPSGRIPDKQQIALKETGEWLKINGEAVYGTRPWKVYFQGPNSKLVYVLRKGEKPPEGSEVYPGTNRTTYVKLTKNDIMRKYVFTSLLLLAVSYVGTSQQIKSTDILNDNSS